MNEKFLKLCRQKCSPVTCGVKSAKAVFIGTIGPKTLLLFKKHFVGCLKVCGKRNMWNVCRKCFELGSQRAVTTPKLNAEHFESFTASLGVSLLNCRPIIKWALRQKVEVPGLCCNHLPKNKIKVSLKTNCLAMFFVQFYFCMPHWPTKIDRRTKGKDELLNEDVEVPVSFFC